MQEKPKYTSNEVLFLELLMLWIYIIFFLLKIQNIL